MLFPFFYESMQTVSNIIFIIILEKFEVIKNSMTERKELEDFNMNVTISILYFSDITKNILHNLFNKTIVMQNRMLSMQD